MKLTRSRLIKVIQETLKEVEFHGETPAGQLTGTEEEDVRFTQQLYAERIMKMAGLTSEEMVPMWDWIKTGDPDWEFLESPQFEKLYDYLGWGDNARPGSGVMPYKTLQGREEMSDEWILAYLAGEVGAGESLGYANVAEQKSRKITKAKLRNIVQGEFNAVIIEVRKGRLLNE